MCRLRSIAAHIFQFSMTMKHHDARVSIGVGYQNILLLCQNRGPVSWKGGTWSVLDWVCKRHFIKWRELTVGLKLPTHVYAVAYMTL